jgi:hypothetical protein
MTQWHPLLSPDEAAMQTTVSRELGLFEVAWGQPEKGWKTSCSFASYGDETGPAIYPRRSITERVICHLLLDLVEDEGLQEIRDYLLMAFKFYQPSPHPRALPSAEPVSVAAEQGESYVRPSFSLHED